MPVIVEERKTSFIDSHKLSANHWYKFLPRRIQYHIANIGVKLGLIRRYGALKVEVTYPNGKKKTVKGYNIITNVGIQHLGDILAGVEATNIDIGFIEPGSGTTTPTISDTDTETPLTPADRLAATTQTRSSTTPFEVVIGAFIGSGKYTRPTTINELAIFFTPDETGDMFARGVLSTGISLTAGATATITYGLVFR